MNEPWKRLIEAERRVMRLESLLQRQNTKIVSVAGAIQNDSQNVTNPFGVCEGGGGTSEINRFPNTYEMWVEWDTVPTLKTGASLNPTADVTSLAEAVSAMEAGFDLNDANLNSSAQFFAYDTGTSLMALYFYRDHREGIIFAGRANTVELYFKLVWYADGDFLADPTEFGGGSLETLFTAEATAGLAIRIELEWPRRNGIGSIVDVDTVIARRTLASTDNFSYGPTYGESGTWSFAMECPANTYHNAGSGTIFLRWGTAAPSIVSGGTPVALPSDIVDGGSPADLPADIIDGGTI